MDFKKKHFITLVAFIVSCFAFGKFGSDSKIHKAQAVEKSIVWDFSSSDWQEEFASCGDPNVDITGWDITVDGLRFLSPSKSKYNTTYLQPGGKGKPTDRVFIFTADYPGKLKVMASNVSSQEDMTRMVEVLPDGGEAMSLPAGSPNNSPITVSFDINSGEHYIYPVGNALRFYSIEYTYSLPERKLDSIYIAGTPTNLEYASGETFDHAGLKVMGKYQDELGDAEITTGIEWTFSPEILTADTTSVTVTASANGKTSDTLIVNNLVVKPTIADILKTVEFPITKNDGWISIDEKNVVYLFYNSILRFEAINDSTTTFNIGTENILEKSSGNYVYQDSGLYGGTCTFIMKNNVLTGFDLTSSYRPSMSGTYLAPHVHAISETHSKVEPTCLSSGHEAYYECDCGKYFADETLNEEILNLETWLAEDGDGYIAPLGHDFGGEVTYTWNEETHECTASWKCQHEGCNETQTETVTGVYVMDTPATCLENEKGHFEATFSITDFVKQSTAENSYVKPDSALGHDFGGEVTYTWNEETHECTASWKCQHEGCNETQTETVTGVYVKDTDATTESNEKGHYEATFTIDGFENQSTPANSVEIPDSKLPSKGLNGGAVAGISVGAVAGAALISYAAMFVVYAKSGKGFKFLFKSFDWLKKLFKMK